MSRGVKYLVVAVGGLLLLWAAASMFVDWGERKVDNYFAAMRADLARLAAAEVSFYQAHHRFTTSYDSLGLDLFPTPGVQLELRADSAAWAAVLSHLSLPTRCQYADRAPPRRAPSFQSLRQSCTDRP